MRWIIQEPRFRFTTLLDAFQRPVDHCPISLEPMEDPVLVCDGHVYDKTSITTWLSEGNKPLSRLGPLLSRSFGQGENKGRRCAILRGLEFTRDRPAKKGQEGIESSRGCCWLLFLSLGGLTVELLMGILSWCWCS